MAEEDVGIENLPGDSLLARGDDLVARSSRREFDDVPGLDGIAHDDAHRAMVAVVGEVPKSLSDARFWRCWPVRAYSGATRAEQAFRVSRGPQRLARGFSPT